MHILHFQNTRNVKFYRYKRKIIIVKIRPHSPYNLSLDPSLLTVLFLSEISGITMLPLFHKSRLINPVT